MKKGIWAILFVLTMVGLSACGSSDGAKKLSVEELQSIYQAVGVQAIDEIVEGVTFSDPAWETTIGKVEEGAYQMWYEELSNKSADASQSIYGALYGLGEDIEEAFAKVEAYREYLISQGYVEDIPGEDELRSQVLFVKEDVAVIIWDSLIPPIFSGDEEERVAEGQRGFYIEIIPIK